MQFTFKASFAISYGFYEPSPHIANQRRPHRATGTGSAHPPSTGLTRLGPSYGMMDGNSNSLLPSQSISQRKSVCRNPSMPVSAKTSRSPRGYEGPEIEETLVTRALDRASLAILLESVQESQTKNKNRPKHPWSGTNSAPAPVTPPNPIPIVPDVPDPSKPGKIALKPHDAPFDVSNSSPNHEKTPRFDFSPSDLSPASPIHGRVVSAELADPSIIAASSSERPQGPEYNLMAELLKVSNSELAKFLGGEGQSTPVDSPLLAKGGGNRAKSELGYGTAASMKAGSEEAKSELISESTASAKVGSDENSERSSGTAAVSSSAEADREIWEQVSAGGLGSCKNG